MTHLLPSYVFATVGLFDRLSCRRKAFVFSKSRDALLGVIAPSSTYCGILSAITLTESVRAPSVDVISAILSATATEERGQPVTDGAVHVAHKVGASHGTRRILKVLDEAQYGMAGTARAAETGSAIRRGCPPTRDSSIRCSEGAAAPQD